MIWSVSMLIRMRGAAMPVTERNASMDSGVRRQVSGTARVRDAAGDGRCGDGGRTCQVRACLRSLPSFKIAVRRADDPQIREAVVADVAAVAARGLVPFEARVLEDAVEAFGLGGALDGRGAGHAERDHAGLHLAPLQHRGGRA